MMQVVGLLLGVRTMAANAKQMARALSFLHDEKSSIGFFIKVCVRIH
jgi:hypothetical protein